MGEKWTLHKEKPKDKIHQIFPNNLTNLFVEEITIDPGTLA